MFRSFLQVSLIAFFLLANHQTHGNEANTPKDAQRHTWNLRNVDIRSIIDEMAIETGKNFVVSPEVKGRVTFVSSHPLTPDELYQAFIALLRVSGFDAVSNGPVVKIIPESNIREEGGRPFSLTSGLASGEISVTVARVKYASAAELARVLKQLVFHFGYMEAYTPANDIIIVDFSRNISRLLDLIHTLDQPEATRVNVVHLANSQSTYLVKIIKSLVRDKGDGFKNLVFAADARSNDILIYGGTPEQLTQIQTLIRQLDMTGNTTTLRTEVISLKYLRAEKLSVIINSLIENYKHEKPDSFPSGPNALSSINQKENLSSSSGTPMPDFSHTLVTSGSAIQNNGANMSDNSHTAVDFTNMAKKIPKSGSVSPFVQWEESTNSIILTAPEDLMVKLKNVIKKLDSRRPQVLIEAVIAEVGVNLANELGVELNTGGRVQLLTRFNSTLPLSGIGSDNNIAISNPPSPDMPGQGLSGAFFSGSNLRFLLRALEQDSRSNILSTPNIVTLDNEPAQIKVGQRISFSIGQIQNNPTGGNPFNYFNQQDIGLILTINPQITSDGSIKLIIEQELSNILPGAVSAGNNPNLSERFIHTTVMANDGDLLVLGGLIQDEWQDSVSKVPVLGDLPIIGFMFRSHEKQLTRQNLMIFLKPTILYNKKDSAHSVDSRYNMVRQQQQATANQNLTASVTIQSPILPERPIAAGLPRPFTEGNA